MSRPTPAEVRARLAALAPARGLALERLSRAIGRNPAYLHQYVTRGSPKRLDEDDRLALAQLLDVDERELGARDPWTPRKRMQSSSDAASGQSDDVPPAHHQ